LSCRTMRRGPLCLKHYACRRRWNDDCGSSFRMRDNASGRNGRLRVKYLFKLLIQRQELEQQ
jgi:hypothetical protein